MAKPTACVLVILISLLCCRYIFGIAGFFLADNSPSVGNFVLTDDVLKQIGTIRDSRLSEISGIAMSRRYENCLWVHNDSGNAPDLFLVRSDGTVLARVRLNGTVNRDWEDVCTFELDGTSRICVGDVGDNGGRYKSYQLYILKEPEIDLAIRADESTTDKKLLVVDDFKKVEFRYEDGPKNCEAFAWDSQNDRFLFAEKGFDRKRKSNLGVYSLNMKIAAERGISAAASSILVATRVANCKLKNSTAMSISGDGKRLVLSSYAVAAIWNRQTGADWAETLESQKPILLPLPIQRQCEAITLNHTGNIALTTSEFTNQPIWQIQVDSAIDQSRSKPKTR